MATALAFLGVSPPVQGDFPAMHPKKDQAAFEAGELVMKALRSKRTLSSFVTKRSFENAAASVAASSGSTNAVLHLLALAREFGVAFDLDDFEEVAARTPVLADLKPGGQFTAVDLFHAGGNHALGSSTDGRGVAP